jgi:glycosyltransferase involved in cell wall biosynthesis
MATHGRDPRRIYNYPGWKDNAYVTLLQAEVVRRGFVVDGVPGFVGALRELTDRERRGLVHIQWPNPVTEEAGSESDAFRRVDIFADALYTAKQWGRPLLWTIHNVLPHDVKHRRAAIKLHEALGRLADAIHVLNPRTVELAADTYAIPEDKVVVIPHSSYEGVYGPGVDRGRARGELGVDAAATAVLFFGWIRPYKGLGDLADAMTVLGGRRDDVALLLAGRPQGDVDGALGTLMDSGVEVTARLERIPDEAVPVWFSAADVLVLPYRSILNSGSLQLAATYGLPVVLPDEEHLVAQFGGEEWVRFFDRERAAASIAELVEDGWHREPAVREAALAFAAANPPERMAQSYAELVEELLDRTA